MLKTVYITKYALTTGMLIGEMDVKEDGSFCYGKPTKDWYETGFSGTDFSLSETDALEKCERMRISKIKSLQKNIQKLEKLNFKL